MGVGSSKPVKPVEPSVDAEGFDFMSKIGFRLVYSNNDINPDFDFWGTRYEE